MIDQTLLRSVLRINLWCRIVHRSLLLFRMEACSVKEIPDLSVFYDWINVITDVFSI